jgi:23S rRNA (adenine2030-N6)-methyltransferase
MNYRHAYHAGNFADVIKHAVVTRIVEYLKRKEPAFRVIDTHAGKGRYDLAGTEASRTDEWRAGIGRLMAANLPASAGDLLKPYLDVVRGENPVGDAGAGERLAVYPGSPLIVRRLLRRQDRLSAIELHPEDADALAALFAGDHQVRVIRLDGWLALGAHLPPKENRGLVLVDPPFEKEGEFDRMVDGLTKAHRRFPGGVYALWYPVKNRREVEGFIKAIRETGIRRVMRIEMTVGKSSAGQRLDGCGMVVVNPPYTFGEDMQILLPALTGILEEGSGGRSAMDWIRGE